MNTICAESKFLGINGFKLIWVGLMEKFHFPCLYKVLHLFFKWPRRAISPTTTTTTKNFKLIRWDKDITHTHRWEERKGDLSSAFFKELIDNIIVRYPKPPFGALHFFFTQEGSILLLPNTWGCHYLITYKKN